MADINALYSGLLAADEAGDAAALAAVAWQMYGELPASVATIGNTFPTSDFGFVRPTLIKGLASTVSPGTSSITASFAGVTSPGDTLTVNAPVSIAGVGGVHHSRPHQRFGLCRQSRRHFAVSATSRTQARRSENLAGRAGWSRLP